MTIKVKIILAVMGIVTFTSVVSAYESHRAADAVVTELQREERSREQAARQKKQDEAAAAAWMTSAHSR